MMSEKRKGLFKIYIALIAVYISSEVVVSLLPIRPYKTQTEILSEHQAGRANRVEMGDVVFLGDSSLGNAVDDGVLTAELGIDCHNLALVALYGPRGDEVMQRRIFSGSKDELPRCIVIMHKPTNWDHRGDAEAVRQLSNSIGPPSLDRFAHANFGRLPSVQRSRSYRSIFFTYRKGLRYDQRDYQKGLAADERASAAISEIGYVPQVGTAAMDAEAPPPLGEFSPAESSADNLLAIFSLAEREGVEVFVAIGPYWEGSVGVSENFVRDLDRWLRDLAVEYDNVSLLYGGVPATPSECIGDTLEHLNSKGRQSFTTWLVPVLKAKLAGDPVEVSAADWNIEASDP